MKELTNKTTQIIQQSLRTAEQVFTGGTVQHFITNGELRDVIDELDSIKNAQTADDMYKVSEMVLALHAISFTVRKGWANPASIPSTVYDYTLDEYQAAVQRLRIPVGGENQ